MCSQEPCTKTYISPGPRCLASDLYPHSLLRVRLTASARAVLRLPTASVISDKK